MLLNIEEAVNEVEHEIILGVLSEVLIDKPITDEVTALLEDWNHKR